VELHDLAEVLQLNLLGDAQQLLLNLALLLADNLQQQQQQQKAATASAPQL
jgi:hypothetical protein